MTGPAARRLGAARLGAALLAAAGLAVPAVAVPASAAQAAGPSAVPSAVRTASGSFEAHTRAATDPADVAVRLTGVSPGTLVPGATLSVTGEVRNTTSRTLGALTVQVRLRPERMQGRAAVEAWADGSSGLDDGPAVVTVTVPGRLAPGARASFTARKGVDTFGLPGGSASFGPRAMTVEVVGAPVPAGTTPADDARLRARPLGVARTFTVWSPDRTPPTLRLGVVVPLVPARPTPDVSEPDVDTLADLAPTGRIGRLTGVAAATPGLTWAVDPALLLAAARAGRLDDEPSTATASPSASASPSAGGAPEPSPSPTGSATVDPALTPYLPGAQEWLSTMRTAVGSQDVWALPFGDTDLVSVARAGEVDLLRQARAAGAAASKEALGVTLQTGLGWPAGGVADRATVDAASRAGFTDLVLAGAGQPSTGPDDVTPAPRSTLLATAGRAGLGGIVADDAMSATFTQAGSGTDAAARQQLVAELAATARESLDSGPRGVVVTAPRDWRVDAANLSQLLAALRSTTWLAVTPVSALRTDPATRTSARTPTYPAASKASELPAAGVAAVADARRRIADLTPAIVDPGPVVVPVERESLSLLGVPWRDVRDRFTARTTALTNRVDQLYGSVRVPTGSGTLLLARTGDLPVTVENTLDHAVNVVLALRPRSGRLVVEKPVPVTVPANAKTRVLVPVRAIADGEVDVEVSILTPALKRIDEAPPIPIRVRSDWESRGITAVASLLVVLLVVGLVRGIRRGRRPSVPLDDVPDPDDIGRVLVDDAGRVLAEARDVTPVGGIPVVTTQLPVDRPAAPRPSAPAPSAPDVPGDRPEPADVAPGEGQR